jgi:hypothetical protein
MMMESLFDIQQGVRLLVVELLGEDEGDGSGEEEED